MKITIDIDCTPDEMRQLMGMPDFRPIQNDLIQKIQEKVVTSPLDLDPTDLVQSWLSTTKAGSDFLKGFLSSDVVTKAKE